MGNSENILDSARLSTCGSVLVEAALALPIFFLFILGMIEMSFGIRTYLLAARAVNIAAHKLASVSALDNWASTGGSAPRSISTEALCLEIAGNTYIEELLRAGGTVEAASSDPNLGGGLSFALAGFPYDFGGVGYPAPRAYELRALYRHECVICNLTGQVLTFRHSAVAVLETARGCTTGSHPPGMIAGYFPNLPPGQRVQSVPRSSLY